jgi:hypothetical protein
MTRDLEVVVVSETVNKIREERMTLCYKMLLILGMAQFADENGCVPIRRLAREFDRFFTHRTKSGKTEENPNIIASERLRVRTLSDWEKTICEQPLQFLHPELFLDDGSQVQWTPRIWSQWDSNFKAQVLLTAFDRLIQHFERNVPGGY